MNKAYITSLITGFIFSLGLGISGMMDTKKVHGFLDIFGKWDPSLILVMGGGVAVTFLLFPIIFKRKSPVLEKKFSLPTNNKVDKNLITGAVLFGIGWGLSGLCPGPAIANIPTLNSSIILFVIFMFIGFFIQENLASSKNQKQDSSSIE